MNAMNRSLSAVRGTVAAALCLAVSAACLPARAQLAHWWNFSETNTALGTVYADQAAALFPQIFDPSVVPSAMRLVGSTNTVAGLNGVGNTVTGGNAVRIWGTSGGTGNGISSSITNFASDFGELDGAVSFTLQTMVQVNGFGLNGNGYLFGNNGVAAPVNVYTAAYNGTQSNAFAYSGNNYSDRTVAQRDLRFAGANGSAAYATAAVASEVNQFGGWYYVAVRGDASTQLLDMYITPVGQTTMANSLIHVTAPYGGIAKGTTPLQLGYGGSQFTATQWNNGVALYSEARTLDQMDYDYRNWFNPQSNNTWWGNGRNTNWTTAGNWTSGAPAAGEYKFGNLYGNSNGTSNNDGVGLSVGGLRFLGQADQAGINAGSVTLTGNALTVSGAITNNSTNPQAIALPLTLAPGAGTFAVTAGGRLTVSQPITTTVGLTKTGAGTLVLSGANTYATATTISAGALEANDGSGLSGNSAVVLAGGVLQGSGTANFSRSVGTGPGQVQWAGDGGFAARGGPLTVTLNNDATTPVGWGAGSFVPEGNALVFGSASANARVVLTNKIDLAGGNRTVRVDSGVGGDLAELAGVVSGESAGLVKTGTGTLILTGTNTYTGNTRVAGGAVEAVDGTGLGSGTNLELAGGVFQGSGTFTRAIGTDAGKVQWTGNGGFAARGAPLTVTLNNNATPPLGWGFDFIPEGSSALLFGSLSSNARVTFQNAVELGGISRTIQVTAGTGNEIAEMSGVISDFALAGIIKAGTGTLQLSAANTYVGSTRVAGGALEAAVGTGLPTNSNLDLAGGVFQGSGVTTFTRGLGTGANQVQWTGSGGFSARGGKHTVNLGGASAAQTWNAANFVANGSALVFGSNSADSETEFQNPVNLGTAVQEVRVNSGTGTDFATLSGVLSGGTGGGLVKTGSGLLKLSATNTYTGGTNIAAGTILLGNAAGLGPSGTITFTGSSTLRFDTGITTDLSGRLKVNDGVTANIDTNGQNVTFNGVTGVGAAVTGVVNKVGAGDLILGTATNALNTASVGWYAGRVTVSQGRVVLGNSLALQNARLDYDGQGGTLSFGSLAAATIGSISGSQNLALANDSSAAVTLTVGSNTYGAASTTTSVGIAAANANTSTTYSGNLSGAGALVKSGVGTLTLSGANSYGGTTTVNGGALGIAGASSLAAGNLVFAGGFLTSNGTATAMPAGGLIESNNTVLTSGFTRGIGTGNDQVRWTGNGGFSARGGNLTVNLGGSGADFDWSATNAPGTNQLLFGWGTSDGTVDFQNPILLTSTVAATRTINVSSGSGSVPEAKITGQIKEAATFAGGLTKAGTGTLELANANNSYTGITTVSGGVLRVTAPGQLGLNATAGALTLNNGNLDLRADASTNFQPTSGAGVTLSGNTVISVDRAVGGTGSNRTHTLGPLTIGGQTLTVRGANGYGLTFGNVTATASPTIVNNAPGTLTLGNVQGPAAVSTLTVAGLGNTTVSGNITQNATNAVALTMNGVAALWLNGTSTASGAATINSGRLYAGTNTSLGTAAVTVNAGNLLAADGVTVANGITVAAAGLYTQNFNTLSSLPAGWSVYTGASSSSIGTASTLTTAATAWNTATGSFANMASATGSTASDNTTQQAARTDRALGVVQSASFGNPGASVNYAFSTAGKTVTGLTIDLQSLNPVGGATTWSLQYGLGSSPSAWTTIDTWTDPNVWGSTSRAYDSTVLGTGLDDQAAVQFRVAALSPQAGVAPFNTIAIDNFTLNYGQVIGSDITTGAAGFSGQVTLSNAAQLTAAGTSTVTFSGKLTGTKGITKIGAGTVSLTADTNDYAGGTIVSAGTLAVNNLVGSGTGTGPVTVRGTGSLGGGGIIGGNVFVNAGGALAPGNSIGALTIGGNLTLDSGSFSRFEIDASSPGLNSADKLILGGTSLLTYGGTLKVTSIAGLLEAGQSWDLFDFTPGNQSSLFANDASFNGVPNYSGGDLPTLTGGLSYQFDYSTGILSVAVPEPGTWVLAGVGAAGAAIARRFRRRVDSSRR